MSTEERTRKRRDNRRKGRSLQRQRALDVLYEADLRYHNDDILSVLEQRVQLSTAQQPIQDYGQQIIKTYCEWADNVDSMIEAASPQWALSRMSIVDRSLLRIGATELMFLDVPVAIMVKEIADLAREFSSDKAVGFTMGVLNRIAEIRATETSGATQNSVMTDTLDVSETADNTDVSDDTETADNTDVSDDTETTES